MKLMFIYFLFPLILTAQETPTFLISIKDHKFSPDTITVKEGQKFKIEVKNEDNSSEEFESNPMHIEKIIGPNKTLRLTLGPFKKGTYTFFGEFHLDTAHGKVVVE